MNENKNDILTVGEIEDDYLDFDELERQLEEGLEDSLSELEFLEEDKGKISNPDNIGNAVMNVIWEQFVIQIGAVAGDDFIKENRGLKLDLRDKAHIQTTENFAEGKIASHNTEIDYKKRYDDWQSNFQRNEDGSIRTTIDNRTGKEKAVLRVKDTKKDPRGENYNKNYDARKYIDKDRPKGSKTVHKDHTISAAEIIRDAEANAHMTREEQAKFANSDVNLLDLDSAANPSKGDSTMTEWLDSEKNGKKPADRFYIDEEELRQRDKEAREEYKEQKKNAEEKSIASGKKSQKAEAFRIGGKALRAAVMGLLAEFVRNIIGKLVLWIKFKEKSLKTFLEQIKEAIVIFLKNIKQTLLTTGITVASTVLNAILGPVVSVIQKIWTLIKQGGKSVKEAIEYVKKPENRKKSFGVLMLEVGKIVMTGLTAMGALVLGEAIEKGLIAFPVFAAQIPLLGSLANILGIFMGAVVAGIAGALVMNLIDKMIAKKQRQEIAQKQIEKGNQVIAKQHQIQIVNEVMLERDKKNTQSDISGRHQEAASIMKDAHRNIMEDFVEDFSENESSSVIDEEDVVTNTEIDKISNDLDNLLNGLM